MKEEKKKVLPVQPESEVPDFEKVPPASRAIIEILENREAIEEIKKVGDSNY
jgi:hypothetical protein